MDGASAAQAGHRPVSRDPTVSAGGRSGARRRRRRRHRSASGRVHVRRAARLAWCGLWPAFQRIAVLPTPHPPEPACSPGQPDRRRPHRLLLGLAGAGWFAAQGNGPPAHRRPLRDREGLGGEDRGCRPGGLAACRRPSAATNWARCGATDANTRTIREFRPAPGSAGRRGGGQPAATRGTRWTYAYGDNRPPSVIATPNTVTLRTSRVRKAGRAAPQRRHRRPQGDAQHRGRRARLRLHPVNAIADADRRGHRGSAQLRRTVRQGLGARIGGIRSANQGVVSIENRDAGSPQIKKIRVVTTVEYFLGGLTMTPARRSAARWRCSRRAAPMLIPAAGAVARWGSTPGAALHGLWQFLGYFTVLSNGLVAWLALRGALAADGGRPIKMARAAAVTAIVLVGDRLPPVAASKSGTRRQRWRGTTPTCCCTTPVGCRAGRASGVVGVRRMVHASRERGGLVAGVAAGYAVYALVRGR